MTVDFSSEVMGVRREGKKRKKEPIKNQNSMPFMNVAKIFIRTKQDLS
jgi:hypothetical protein